jgi:hypothetical protein
LQVACSTENEYQRHPGHEWGFVLEGQLEVKIGFEEYILGPGDSGSFDSTVPTAWPTPAMCRCTRSGSSSGEYRAASRRPTRTGTVYPPVG